MREAGRFYRFDYGRYLALRPALRSATTAEALAAIADDAETQAIAEAAQREEITLDEARHGWILATCCIGEGLPFDGAFARFVSVLGRKRGAEDAAETLCELAAGGKNMEGWLLPSYGLMGLLTPQETSALALAYAPLAKAGRLRTGKIRTARRGGLFGFVKTFFRRLFDSSPQMEEMVPLVAELLDEAARNGEGIAAVQG